MGQFYKITCERDGHGSHAARLHNQQKYPAIKKRDRGMKCFTQVRVLPADVWTHGRKFGPDECGGECKQPAEYPRTENQEWSVDLKRDHRGVHKNPRADD